MNEAFDFHDYAVAKAYAVKTLNAPYNNYFEPAAVVARALLALEDARGLPVDLNNLKLNPTVQLVSGHYFNFVRPKRSWMLPSDIGHALSKVARFGGSNKDGRAYSVAQHCTLGSYYVSPEYAFEFLLHDAPEFVTGDCMSPFKQLLPDFKFYENKITAAMAERFMLSKMADGEVKIVDLRMAVTERRDLMTESDQTWSGPYQVEPFADKVEIWSPEYAAMRWVDRFNELWPAHCKKNGRDHDEINAGEPSEYVDGCSIASGAITASQIPTGSICSSRIVTKDYIQTTDHD